MGGAFLAYILTTAISIVWLHAIADGIGFAADEGKQKGCMQQQQTTRIAVHSACPLAQNVRTIERHNVEAVSEAVSSKGC